MNEILFLVERDLEGGYIAQAMGEAIFTQADDLIILKQEIKDAVHCHFPDPDQRPKIIRLHIVQEEVFAS
ncbi:MAG: 2-oxoisovalerate dehydrogenase E1 subunit beta [Cyanobacteria bacterium RI_101]|nr:2-oxoisovalerate dehydrogenase E1 subunit beta [Cyanobacteria bacterium RI_101]